MAQTGILRTLIYRLTLIQKMFIMVLIPIIGLVGFAGIEVTQKMAFYRDMRSTETLTTLAVKTTRLIDALDLEQRLLGNVLAGAEDTTTLVNQLADTDTLITEFQLYLEAAKISVETEAIAKAGSSVADQLDELERVHTGLKAGRTPGYEKLSTFDELNGTLPTVIDAVTESTADPKLQSALRALNYLTQLRLTAGQERALLNMIFVLDMIDTATFREMITLIERQDGFEKAFFDHTTAEIAEIYRKATDIPEIAQIRDGRERAISGLTEGFIGFDAGVWQDATSIRIEAQGLVSQQLAQILLDKVQALRRQASRQLWTAAFVALLSTIAAFALSILIAHLIGKALSRTSEATASVAAQIMSSVQQLTASTSETATAVTETSTTVDELRQTSMSAAEKAEATSKMAERSLSVAEDALDAVSNGGTAMQGIRDGVEDIAGNIVQLSEKTVRIGEIIETVQGIAEQSNLLAVNASIEAATAGEHGRGFAVVAGEVKALAQRSKEATDEIRAVLSEIEKSSNAAVMITEQGVKRVEDGSILISQLGDTIEELARVIETSADATSQISLISNQQLTGIEQINEALKNVEGAASDNARGANELEQAAEQMTAVSLKITSIIRGSDTV